MGDTSLGDVRQWLRAHLAPVLPGLSECSVRIKGDVEWRPIVRRINVADGIKQQIEFGFAAAHYLPQLPADHKCRRMHGHSFGVAISTPDSLRLIGRARSLHEKLDHQLLNDIPGLDNPTSENLARWWWDNLSGRPGLIDEIIIQETCTTGCIYRGES
ncbi:MAG: 6-carboxytetrahydropterin synthase [candidate division Zixibacteria bacterium]|nr:6-carboxytetrahydropterin synthase [candidate division Zixibacteria bacterium]